MIQILIAALILPMDHNAPRLPFVVQRADRLLGRCRLTQAYWADSCDRGRLRRFSDGFEDCNRRDEYAGSIDCDIGDQEEQFCLERLLESKILDTKIRALLSFKQFVAVEGGLWVETEVEVRVSRRMNLMNEEEASRNRLLERRMQTHKPGASNWENANNDRKQIIRTVEQRELRYRTIRINLFLNSSIEGSEQVHRGDVVKAWTTFELDAIWIGQPCNDPAFPVVVRFGTGHIASIEIPRSQADRSNDQGTP